MIALYIPVWIVAAFGGFVLGIAVCMGLAQWATRGGQKVGRR